MNEWAAWLAAYTATVVEIIATLVIIVAILQFLYYYFFSLWQPGANKHRKIRLRFGSSLALSLELLLAADILSTAVEPSWDGIGKLAAVAALRTALNYFLERELDKEGTKVGDA